MTKTCVKCGVEKPLEGFYVSRRGLQGRRARCVLCVNAENRAIRARNIEKRQAADRAYYEANKEHIKAKVLTYRNEHVEKARRWGRESMARSRIAARKAILDGYGGRCACCGETEPIFLALDHVNDDGNLERKSRRGGGSFPTYRDAIRRGFPSDYQLLCHNCNMGKSLNGGICPHESAEVLSLCDAPSKGLDVAA